MQTFEGQCAKLQDELADVRSANRKLEAEKAALEAEVRKLRLSTVASCDTSGQATSTFELPSQSQPIRPQTVVAQPAASVGGWVSHQAMQPVVQVPTGESQDAQNVRLF